MKFVVRSDVGNRPAWIKQDKIRGGSPLFDMTESETDAFVFSDFDYAQLTADIWSDVPGVWYVAEINT